MGLFDLFRKKYDMDTLEGINAIPVPAKNYNTGDPTKDCIYYVLQRKATEHKKNKNLDLAIACLRKSNELSDYEARPLLSEKDYLRLVKYLEYAGNYELANQEKEQIYARHPEFLDKRFSNLPRIKEAILKNKEYKNDYVMITTNRNCPLCSKYNRKIFSTTSKGKKYPKLPAKFEKEGGFCPNCIVGISLFFDGINTVPEDN